jgi:hypothetical protein
MRDAREKVEDVKNTAVELADRVVDTTKTESPKQDCLPCRLTGAAVFGGTGAYAIYQGRLLPLTQPAAKRYGMFALGAGFISLGLYRLVN